MGVIQVLWLLFWGSILFAVMSGSVPFKPSTVKMKTQMIKWLIFLAIFVIGGAFETFGIFQLLLICWALLDMWVSMRYEGTETVGNPDNLFLTFCLMNLLLIGAGFYS